MEVIPNEIAEYGTNTLPSERIVKYPSWWRRRSRMERGLIMALIFVSVLAAISSIVLFIFYSRSVAVKYRGIFVPPSSNNTINEGEGNKTKSKICSTQACLDEAVRFDENMNRSVNPCDNFYQFVCGKFKQKIIPKDKPAISIFSILMEKLTNDVIQILEEPMKNNESLPTELYKTYYSLCMNTSKNDKFGTKPLLKLIELAGDMPLLAGETWDDTAWLWTDLTYQLRKMGFVYRSIIGCGIVPDLKNPGTRIIHLAKPSLGLDINVLIQGSENEVVKAYYNYMVETLVLLGATRSSAEKEMKEALQFEIELANVCVTPSWMDSIPTEDLGELYSDNKITIKSLTTKFPKIQWMDYIKNIISFPISFNEQETVLVDELAYFERLEKLMDKTPKRVQANYLLWRAIKDVVQFLPQNFREKQLKFVGKLYGITTWPDPQNECATVVSNSLVHAVAAGYIKRYIKNKRDDLITQVQDLVDRVGIEFGNSLRSAAWMDEQTRNNAMDKLAAMGSNVAYNNELLDDAKVAEFYEPLKMDGEKPYLLAGLAVSRHKADLELKRLREKVIKGDWQDFFLANILVINAHYNPMDNAIVIPAGILQHHFYSEERPNYLNYGAVGWVLGHEITHGFDGLGRKFDKNGNLAEWWDEKTKELFITKTKCLVNQFSNYTITPINVKINGNLTLGENIADNGAAKIAYKAYQKWISENHEEERLPGFEKFTPNQMFWVSAATTWCGTSRTEYLQRLAVDEHPPGEFRVRGTLSNSEDFARDFDCPVGSPMNPKEKCVIW